MLSLYRHVLRLRHSEAAFAGEDFAWLGASDDVLCYRRGTDVTVVVNVSGLPVELPPHDGILIASGELAGGVLPPDIGVWLRNPVTRVLTGKVWPSGLARRWKRAGSVA